jgi:hypothetical protein
VVSWRLDETPLHLNDQAQFGYIQWTGQRPARAFLNSPQPLAFPLLVAEIVEMV